MGVVSDDLVSRVNAIMRTHDPLEPWLTESHWDDDFWIREAVEIANRLDRTMTVAAVRDLVDTVLQKSIPGPTDDDGVDEWRTSRIDQIAAEIHKSL